MTKEQWLKIAINMVFKAKDEETFDAWFVKYLITAIGEQVEDTKQDGVLQERPISTQGGRRSTKRNQSLSKAQREAQALREESEEDYGQGLT